VFIVLASGGQKPQFWANVDIFGSSCSDPLSPMMAIFGVSSRSVYSVVLWHWKTPIFAVFWISAFSGVANWQQSEKGEHECTTTNVPLSNGIKIVSVFQRLHGEIGRTISDFQKRDEQTNRQTKKLNFFGCPGGGWNPSPTKLGVMIEDIEHVLAHLKL